MIAFKAQAMGVDKLRRQNGLWSLIDIDATAVNADKLLSKYEHHKAMAHRQFYPQSSNFDGLPKATPKVGSTERHIINGLDYDVFCNRCEQIIEDGITNKVYSKILKYTYIIPLATDNEIMERIGYGRSSFYRKRKKALVAFAEQWPPYPDELLVYKEGAIC